MDVVFKESSLVIQHRSAEHRCDEHPVNIFIIKIKGNTSICIKKSVQQTPKLMDASLYQVPQQMRANLLYSTSVTTYTPYSFSWHS